MLQMAVVRRLFWPWYNADSNGDIIISSYNRLYKVDHTDGSGIAMVDLRRVFLTEATTDSPIMYMLVV